MSDAGKADDVSGQATEECASVDFDATEIEQIAEELAGPSRRTRQHAAARLAEIAHEDASAILLVGMDLVDALNRPEGRTRWECLDALTELVALDSRLCDKAIAGAEASLFDEESGPVRLAALRFLCKLGATTENRSEKTWPLIDEAIQCYHGDLEFSDMMAAVVEFSSGKLSPSVKESLAARMAFDAKSGKGSLKRRAEQIIENVK